MACNIILFVFRNSSFTRSWSIIMWLNKNSTMMLQRFKRYQLWSLKHRRAFIATMQTIRNSYRRCSLNFVRSSRNGNSIWNLIRHLQTNAVQWAPSILIKERSFSESCFLVSIMERGFRGRSILWRRLRKKEWNCEISWMSKHFTFDFRA